MCLHVLHPVLRPRRLRGITSKVDVPKGRAPRVRGVIVDRSGQMVVFIVHVRCRQRPQLHIYAVLTEPERELRDSALAFRCDDVLDKFCSNFEVTQREAESLFLEVKRWLWLSAVVHQRKVRGDEAAASVELIIDHDMTMIDEMWHTFVLFTREYHSFCAEFFGHYLHHAPTTERQKSAMAEKARGMTESEREAELTIYERRWSYIYDLIGHDATETWKITFPERYPGGLDAHRKTKKRKSQHDRDKTTTDAV